MRWRLAGMVLAGLLTTLGGVAVAPPPADAQLVRPDYARTPCPELTDSVYRLYSAYFGRVPDETGWDFWVESYSDGSWNLDRMSQFFSTSPEFIDMYGLLDNGQFVDLVYANVLDRAPDAEGRAYWIGRLDAGLERGTLMIFFSESKEYVEDITNTHTPMAGYLRWYPEGTAWHCQWGSGTYTPTRPTPIHDVLVVNTAAVSTSYTIHLLDDGAWTEVAGFDLTANEVDYFRDNDFWTPEITAFAINSGPSVVWIFVEYPSTMPMDRPGWGFQQAAGLTVED